jgi:hypothetical protein
MKQISLALIVLFALSAAGANESVVSSGGVLSVPGGRYVFGQIGDSVLATFMLDTQTGRLWKYQLDQKRGLILMPINYYLANGQISLVPMRAEDEIEMWKQLKGAPPESETK